jgi:hypothetical protein
MKTLLNLAIAIPLATALMFGQQPADPQADKDKARAQGQADAGSANLTGHIMDANCSQASSLTSAPDKETAKKDVMKNCAPTASSTSFALLTDDGRFLKLDDTGNSKVTAIGPKKGLKASVTGKVDGDMLKVDSLTKM